MNFLPVPKILRWQRNLDQRYSTDKRVLVTSGCSYTASTLQLDSPASWPGYMVDRCGFDMGLDMSWPGAGNLYIHDSVIYAIEHVVHDPTDCLVIVMWSGLDRLEKIMPTHDGPDLAGRRYVRIQTNHDPESTTKMSMEKILHLAHYLSDRNIAFAYTLYSNVLWPPFLPKRDTTNNFQDYLSSREIKDLQKLPWAVTHNCCLYEWAFTNDYLESGDYFHPPAEGNLAWTDGVLLPALIRINSINLYHA